MSQKKLKAKDKLKYSYWRLGRAPAKFQREQYPMVQNLLIYVPLHEFQLVYRN